MQFFHKQLNIHKNIEIGYVELPKGQTLNRYVKQFKVPAPQQADINGQPRLMLKKDIAQVYKLYNQEMEKRCKTYFYYSQDELLHQLMPKEGVVYTVVIENKDKVITDFVSFYSV